MDGSSPELYQDPSTGAAQAKFPTDKILSGLTNLSEEKVVQYQAEIAEHDKPIPFDQSAEKEALTKEERDTLIKKTLEEEGETAAISVGVSALTERMKMVTGTSDVDANKLMKIDAQEWISKLFEEKVKNELRLQNVIPSTDEEMKEDDWEKIKALSQLRAKEYKDKSLREITGEVVEDIYNNVDFETFLWAVLGKDVGEGRYGKRSENTVSDKMSSNPTEFVLESFQKNQRFQPDYLARAFAVCQDQTVIEDVEKLRQNPHDEEARKKIIEHLKEVIGKDPKQSKKFVWGLYVALGHPAQGAKISSEEAVAVVKALAESKLSASSIGNNIPEAKVAA
ncbi:MAG: hypothetical protein ABI758_05055 [Candidatus Woesebacteria bacterium]